MLYFDDWALRADGQVIAHQYDNLTRNLVVKGDIPSGWIWTMLVQVGEAMDILPLTIQEEGLGIVLTAEQLSVSGYYTMQLRATRGELVRHTNTIDVYIPVSLSGDKQWPTVPSEFAALECRVIETAQKAEYNAERSIESEKHAQEAKEAAQDAANAAEKSASGAAKSERAAAEHKSEAEQAAHLAQSHVSHPPIIGENGNWWNWDGMQYVDSERPSQGGMAIRQGNNLYSNALKGVASGATIRLDDVGPLKSTVKVKVSGGDDPAAVSVLVYEKNLFDYRKWLAWCNSGIGNKGVENATYLGEDCFSYLLWRDSATQNFTDITFKENTQYTFTLEWSFFDASGGTPTVVPMLVFYTDGSYSPVGSYYGDQTKFKKATFTSDANKTISHFGMNRYGKTCTVYVKKNMQIEVGTASTAYEPYTEPVGYPAQVVYGDNIFDVQAIDNVDIYTTTVNGEDAFCPSVERVELPVHFEPSTQYVISFEVACPSVPEGWRVNGSVFEVAYIDDDGAYTPLDIGRVEAPYNDFQKFEWVSPPRSSIESLTFMRPTIEDSDGIVMDDTTGAIKTNMTIRPVSAECEVPSIYPTMTLTIGAVDGENIFDVQAIDNVDIYTTTVNGEDAFCPSVERVELPVHFEPSTQYVISFEVACPSVPEGWRVNGSVFEVAYIDDDGAYTPLDIGRVEAPYNDFQKFEWVSPPRSSIEFLIFKRPTIEDSDGIVMDDTTGAIKTNMTIRPLVEVPANVTMNCEYNRDINKAFEQLTQAIVSMGGNI